MVMRGFKSFAKRTELMFGGGFNCVLGPNGSGKSNILDALCFVLGRTSSKSLRAEKSANLIYNGGKTKQPMKEAEVSIYFDNSNKTFPTNDKEIKISRIVRQNGQSVYKINDKKKTRQEVVDLMSIARINPDGFNIILQGDIVSFVEMSSVERRRIVEEISGISVYEEKKDKAMRELGRVDERLNEAEIILKERETYLRELKKERNQALKFKELRDRLKENKASHIYMQIDRKEKEKTEFEKKINEKKKKLDEVDKQIKSAKSKIEAKKREITAITKEIEEKGERQQVKLHKEVEGLKVSLASDKTRIDSCRGEIQRIKQRKGQLKGDQGEQLDRVKDLEAEKEALEKEIKDRLKEQNLLDQQLKQFRKKNEIDNADEIGKDIEELDKSVEDKEKEIQKLREQQQNMLREKDRIEFQIQSIDETIGKVLEVEKENKAEIEALKKKKEEFKKSTLELNKRLNDDSTFAAQLAEKKKRLEKAREELIKLKARNLEIKEKVSANKAVQAIIKDKRTLKGIYGTVSELGTVGTKYSLALEVAAGNKVDNVVVEDDSTAARCIKYLKDKKLGIASFIPLNKIRPKHASPELKKHLNSKGVYGLAVDLIKFDPRFKKVFSYVFGDILIVDNINVARRIGIGTAKMVTLDGDMALLSGVMRGGYRQRKKGKGMAFAEKEVLKDIDEYEEVVSSIEKALSLLEDKREENEERISRLREHKAHLEGEIIKAEKSLHLESGDLVVSKKQKKELEDDLGLVDKQLNKVNMDISKINRELANVKIKKQQLRSKINQLKNPRLVAELNAFEGKKTDVKETLIKLEAEMRNTDNQIKIAAPEKEKIESIIKQHDKEIKEFDDEIKNLSEKIKQEQKQLVEKEKKSQQFYSKYKKLFNERSKLTDDVNKAEHKVEAMREVSRKTEIDMNTLSLEDARVKAELAGMQEEFKQYEGVKIDTKRSEQVIKSEITRFENMVQNMGSVNMRALEIYDSVEKEYNALTNKKEKLSLEKNDVLAMIAEIEEKKKGLFIKTLEVVNNNFQKIFGALSKKGEAFLALENPENPFEAGLRILVRLTGKKFLDIRSLSGGEKTMTALAFIFSIQEHEPHSFYVLDEVDAALDKHNSEKLATLVRKYVEKAQYVVISHNDALISEADNLYGISMNEFGISNVTSLKI